MNGARMAKVLPPGLAPAGGPDRRGAFIALLDGDQPGGLVHVDVAAPVVALEALLALRPGEPAVLWDPPEGVGFAGVGAAATVGGAGPGRFAAIQRDGARILARVHAASIDGGPATSPRMFGGLAFAAGSAGAGTWREFDDGTFTLPRWRYERVQGSAAGARLTFCARRAEVTTVAARRGIADQLDELLAGLATFGARAPRPAAARPRHLEAETQLSSASWTEMVTRIREEIDAGRFAKIVAARAATISLSTAPTAVDVLAQLADHAGCTRYAVRRATTTFLGSTPERLIVRHGRQIATEALAGSIAVGGADDRAPAALLASGKDRREHALVVDAIVAVLGPHCASLDVPREPSVRQLRHVLHLATPIRGELAADRHVLQLVAELHPTPAVGGVPSRDATAWIERHEPAPRGWYAGPVGWFDASGDGEFAVALRGGVLDGERATIYAGAGIVAGSDPDAEYTETTLKQRTMRAALLQAAAPLGPAREPR